MALVPHLYNWLGTVFIWIKKFDSWKFMNPILCMLDNYVRQIQSKSVVHAYNIIPLIIVSYVFLCPSNLYIDIFK